MLLHQALTLLDIFSIAIGERVLSDVILDGSSFRVQTARNDAAAQITVGDNSQQSL
jgi:hypothetical protein